MNLHTQTPSALLSPFFCSLFLSLLFSLTHTTYAPKLSATRAPACCIHLLKCQRHVARSRWVAARCAPWFSSWKIILMSFAAMRTFTHGRCTDHHCSSIPIIFFFFFSYGLSDLLLSTMSVYRFAHRIALCHIKHYRPTSQKSLIRIHRFRWKGFWSMSESKQK